jgi:CDP-diacylglycerol---serine O-phosphatidyltransferase
VIPREGRPGRFRRGASILPSLFTTGNLFLGFWSIVKVLQGDFGEAAPLIGWAIVLDMLDGRIARLTGTSSEFGAELDSLADVISFGVAPALLAYGWGFSAVPRGAWVFAFIFAAAGAIRLARFNVQRHAVDGRYFIGLPIPMAAAPIAALVHFRPEPLGLPLQGFAAVAMVISLATLMVSTLRYPSFKNVDLRRRRSYISVLGIALGMAVLFLHREILLLGLAATYALWGPAAYAASLVSRRRGNPPPPVPTHATTAS